MSLKHLTRPIYFFTSQKNWTVLYCTVLHCILRIQTLNVRFISWEIRQYFRVQFNARQSSISKLEFLSVTYMLCFFWFYQLLHRTIHTRAGTFEASDDNCRRNQMSLRSRGKNLFLNLRNFLENFIPEVALIALRSTKGNTRKTPIPCLYSWSEKLVFSTSNSTLGQSRIAVFEDCKATTVTTRPPQLVFSNCYFNTLFNMSELSKQVYFWSSWVEVNN